MKGEDKAAGDTYNSINTVKKFMSVFKTATFYIQSFIMFLHYQFQLSCKKTLYNKL